MNAGCPSRGEIAAYLDRALTPEEQQVIEEHLRRCPECARQIEELRPINDLIAQRACPLADDRFDALLRGRDSAKTAAVLDHMEACPLCRRELEAFSEADFEAPPAPAPAGAEQAFFARFSVTVGVPLSDVPLAEDAAPLVLHRQLGAIDMELRFAGKYSGLSMAVGLRDRASSRPLVGTVVDVSSASGNYHATAVTDNEGIARLSLRSLKPAEYSLELALDHPTTLRLDVHR